MAKNIIEKLEAKGMNEISIKKFIGKIVKAYKSKKLDKLTNDKEYQSMVKKYNLNIPKWGAEDASAKDVADQLARTRAKFKKAGLKY
tara:strand:+ start:1467 stop:1727 length:261 start_codon:yes stop_codon:yes gene_type:complete